MTIVRGPEPRENFQILPNANGQRYVDPGDDNRLARTSVRRPADPPLPWPTVPGIDAAVRRLERLARDIAAASKPEGAAKAAQIAAEPSGGTE